MDRNYYWRILTALVGFLKAKRSILNLVLVEVCSSINVKRVDRVSVCIKA
jgi:hypothetical protein